MRRIYCVFDGVAQTWIGQLVVDRADAPVIRMFHDLCADQATMIGKHPADYSLRFLGNITDDGSVLPCTPEVVATGRGWLEAQDRMINGNS